MIHTLYTVCTPYILKQRQLCMTIPTNYCKADVVYTFKLCHSCPLQRLQVNYCCINIVYTSFTQLIQHYTILPVF